MKKNLENFKNSTEIWTMGNNCWIWDFSYKKKDDVMMQALLVSHLIVVFCDIKSHPSCSASTKVNFSVTFTAILFTLGKFFLTPSSCCLYHIFSFIGCQESWLRKIIAFGHYLQRFVKLGFIFWILSRLREIITKRIQKRSNCIVAWVLFKIIENRLLLPPKSWDRANRRRLKSKAHREITLKIYSYHCFVRNHMLLVEL